MGVAVDFQVILQSTGDQLDRSLELSQRVGELFRVRNILIANRSNPKAESEPKPVLSFLATTSNVLSSQNLIRSVKRCGTVIPIFVLNSRSSGKLPPT